MSVSPRRGYPLSLTGIVCLGGLACGPGLPSDDETTGITTGFPLDTSGEDQPEDPSTGDGDGDGDGNNEPMCLEPGWKCGEFGICQCSGDVIPDSCGCEPVECTEDAHCRPEQACVIVSDPHFPERACVPDHCETLWDINFAGDVEPSTFFADATCAEFVSVFETPWTEITGLDSLRYVHGNVAIASNPALVHLDGLATLERVEVLIIVSNPNLTNIAGLAGLQEIVVGGEITNNSLLPTADIMALLAEVPGGDTVFVCGNLDGEPC